MNKFKELSRLLNNYRKEQILITILLLVTTALSVGIPYLIKLLIDGILQGDKYQYVLRTAIIILIVTIITVLLNAIQNYNWHKLRQKSVKHLRKKMFDTMLRKEISYFKKVQSGEILAKIMQDVVIVAQCISIGIPMVVSNTIRLLLIFAIMVYLNVTLTIITLVIIPIYYILFNALNKRLRCISNQERIRFSNLTNQAQEKILGITTIKIFRKENYFRERFKNTLDEHFKYIKKNLFLTSLVNGVTTLITSLLPVVVLLVGSNLVWKDELTVGSLVAFYSYLSYVYEPINNLSDYYMGLQTTLGMSNRILDFLKNDIGQECIDKDNISEINSIRFKNVSFSYGEEDEVITNLSLYIEKGDKIAITGASGCGKTTIGSLLMKIYENYSGKITINDIDLKNISKKSIYDMVAVVEQESFVFEGDVLDNIIFDDDKENTEQLAKSLEISGTNRFVDKCENKLAHKVVEFGNNLSGGQKQRVCISRALAKDFDLLILDEATSALDYGLEKEIIDKLNNYLSANNKTLITISHRPEILSICNKIINLDEKHEIIEQYN
ncbi:ABC transporter ATP-binding protein [Clostridiaceae bacterium M8S5]|nr:ABC transporter ATP-binding protein [Clostridiaceae bacterium M8S5]